MRAAVLPVLLALALARVPAGATDVTPDMRAERGNAAVPANAQAPVSASTVVPDDDFERQVLVMLRPPAHRTGVRHGYGARPPPAARRLAEAIARRQGLRVLASWPMPSLGLDCYVMRLGPGDDRARVLARLAGEPRVQWAQPMQVFDLLGAGDPLYAAQPTARRWHLRELHRVATGEDVVVAQVDSGVAVAHPDLRGQVALARNFVPGEAFVAEQHGTEVAGIIAARADNGLGMAGVAPRARLLALRACWQVATGGARCSSFSLAQALQFALHAKARVINLSLTGPRDELLSRLIDAALARGSTVVAAMDVAAADGGFPASRPGVLAVAGDEGACPLATGLRAPGEAVPTTTPPSGWGLVSGASFAAAQVSGLAALMLQVAPAMTPAQVGAALHASAIAAAPAQAARVDACSALARVAPGGRCPCACGAVAGQGF
jgi:hypothetical protein